MSHPTFSHISPCILVFQETTLVRPYLIDLGSTNGSFVNGEQIEPQRYVELLEKDVVRFGYSSREFVVLNADA